tara:strand:+ start:660 stop:866 length:207 start_codon:yes stop_codon:yes gene_type:complete
MSRATKDLKDNVVFLRPKLKLKKYVGIAVQYSTPIIVEAYSEEEAEQLILEQEDFEIADIEIAINQLQ